MRIAYIQTISKNKNENQTSRLGVESRFVKKKVFSPQTLKQCHMTKICSGKGCNRYHTTVVYNVLKSNFEYLHSRWKYSHLIRVLFWVSCTLNTWLQWMGQREVQNEMRNIYVWGFGASFKSSFFLLNMWVDRVALWQLGLSNGSHWKLLPNLILFIVTSNLADFELPLLKSVMDLMVSRLFLKNRSINIMPERFVCERVVILMTSYIS